MSGLKVLEELLADGKIDRREFLSRATAAGVSAAAATTALGRTALAATPKQGGRFRIGAVGGATSDSLDPATMLDFMTANIGWQTRNNLVEIDSKARPIPELAQSFEANDDATRWVFKLRKGVQFHNGKSFTAEDVVFSINRHRGEDSASVAKSLLESLADVKVDDKHTVVFTLNSGNVDFPFVLTDYHLQICPAGTEDFEDGMGTGGYVLQSYDPGVRSFATRNPNYWKEGRAHFDEVESINITDSAARMSALLSDDHDAMLRVERQTAKRLAEAPNVQLVEAEGGPHFLMSMLTNRPPFNDVNLRRAMKHAVDREELVAKVLHGYGTPGNDHPIAPYMRYYASELPPREYDPDKAKFYLKKAGMDSFATEFHASDLVLNIAVDAGVLYKEQAAPASIDVTVMQEPADGYWSDVWRVVPFFANYFSTRPSEDTMFSIGYAADAAWNPSFWDNERFNKLLRQARAELDEAKRRDMYVEMQRIMRDEGGSIIPLFLTNLDGASAKIRHGPIAGNFDFDGWRAHERWWFA